MTPAVVFPERLTVPPEVVRIAARLEEHGFEAWCVGGSIRDALLDEGGSDFDIATSAPPHEVQGLFRRTVAVGIRHGTIGVLDRDQRLHEVTTFRRDVSTDGRHAVVEFGASLEEDLARRDLTINAIAYHPLRAEWRDPFGGAEDLAARRIRAVGAAADRFREDYLRILRALRFAARFDFRIDEPTWVAAREQSHGLAQLSVERVRDEWFKSLRTARSLRRLVELWWESGAAAVRLPELAVPSAVDRMRGVLAVPPAERDPVLLTAVLCTDPAGVLARLRASNEEIARAESIARLPRAPASNGAADVRRWLSLTGPAADDLIAAERLASGVVPEWVAVVEAVRAAGDPITRRDLAVGGADLLAAGLEPGPEIGRLLDRLLAMVLDDPALNDRETLIARARTLA